MHNSSKTAAVILAAGSSIRMGMDRNKLLLPLHDRPVLAHVIQAALGSRAHPVVLVLGHQAAEVRALIQPYLKEQPLTIVENPHYRQGMSTSMQVGLQELLSNDHQGRPDHVIFLLGDQPMISTTIIERLLDAQASTNKRIMLPLYQGQRGNPVIFSLELSEELLMVTGDEGGRSVLKRHADEVATLEIGELSANFDVDTWEAYQAVQEIWKQQEQR